MYLYMYSPPLGGGSIYIYIYIYIFIFIYRRILQPYAAPDSCHRHTLGQVFGSLCVFDVMRISCGILLLASCRIPGHLLALVGKPPTV